MSLAARLRAFNENMNRGIHVKREETPIKIWLLAMGTSALGLSFVSVAVFRWHPGIMLGGLLLITVGLKIIHVLRQPPPADLHEVTIYRDKPRYWAMCKCGWAGPSRHSEAEARSDAHQHSHDLVSVTQLLDEWDEETLDDLGFVLASRRILDSGQPIGILWRDAGGDEADSGWRVLAGTEDDGYLGNPENLVPVSASVVVDLEPSLAPLLTTHAPCAFERTDDGVFRRTKLKTMPPDTQVP